MWMMSGPAPDWMAAVMRACRSLALMNSNDHLGPERLGRVTGLALELDVARGDEVDPADDVEPRALGKGGSAPRGQDAFQAGRGGGARGDGSGEERATADCA